MHIYFLTIRIVNIFISSRYYYFTFSRHLRCTASFRVFLRLLGGSASVFSTHKARVYVIFDKPHHRPNAAVLATSSVGSEVSIVGGLVGVCFPLPCRRGGCPRVALYAPSTYSGPLNLPRLTHVTSPVHVSLARR